MLSIISQVKIPASVWNNFVDSCSDAWLLHRSEMLDAFDAWDMNSDISFAIVDKEEIVGVFPLFVKRIPYKRFFHINYLDSVGGLALSDALSAEKADEVRMLVRGHLKSLSSFWYSPRISLLLNGLAPARDDDVLALKSGFQGFIDQDCSTHSYHVNLQQSEDCLWSGMMGRSRTAIRKALKNGVSIRKAICNDDDLKHYYSLHMATCTRTGARPHAREFFKLVWDLFLEQKLCDVWFAEQNREIIAACVTGAYKKRAHYWSGASLRAGQQVGANNLLIWTAIKHYQESGYLKFDCGEAFLSADGGKMKGLSDFKASFGGDIVPYFKGSIGSGSAVMNALTWLRRRCGGA